MWNAFGQARAIEDHTFMSAFHLHTQAGLNKQEWRRGRPGLWRTRYRIQNRPLPRVLPFKTAEEFGQAVKFHRTARVEQGEENLTRKILVAIRGETFGNQSVVVRPHRSVVIGERIVACLA